MSKDFYHMSEDFFICDNCRDEFHIEEKHVSCEYGCLCEECHEAYNDRAADVRAAEQREINNLIR